MGVVRTLLALGVVRDHVPFFQYPFLIKGGFAVILFYVISGFYMAMIIKESYSKLGKGWEWKFLLNRALRLYPAYWLVLIFTIIAMATMGTPTIYTSQLGLSAIERALALFCDTFIVGLDALVSGGLVHWHDKPGLDVMLNWQVLPVFVGWTIAVELTFYAFAAFFIMRTRRSAYFALALGAYIRLYFVFINGKALMMNHFGIGYEVDPWGYHFFGIALIFFMFGYLAYEIYVDLGEKLKSDPSFLKFIRIAAVALGAILLVECFMFNGYQGILDYEDIGIWVTIPFFVLFVPMIFLLTRNSKIDNIIGQFSYPIYLCHYIVTEFANKVLHLPVGPWTTLVAVFVSGAVIVFGLELPIDRLRHRLTFGKKPELAEKAEPISVGG